MVKSISVSLIVTSYNQARTVRFLFESLARQTFTDFEVIVADDGSSDGSEQLCKEKRSYPIKFVTQADQGYRKSKIINLAIRQSEAPYLIFIDGDVILERHFIEDHLMLKKPKHFVCGRRVDLGPFLSGKIVLNEITRGHFDRLNLHLITSGLSRDSTALKRAVRITQPLFRRILGYHSPLDILGSNFSAWKEDIFKVNGFNESLESYWGEDGDLYVRLRNSGLTSIGAKALCIQYHVFHPRRAPTLETVKKYQLLLNDTEYRWADCGFSQNK
jgi:glycosyltransferase involved in cell wall biosynthesis